MVAGTSGLACDVKWPSPRYTSHTDSDLLRQGKGKQGSETRCHLTEPPWRIA